METWQQFDQSYDLGWRIEYQPERRVIQIRLSIPKTMARKDVNYPLRPLHVERLDLVAYMIGRVTGMHLRDLRWESMAVREVAFTADLLVQDKYADHKEGIIRALADLPHAGKRLARDTSVSWRSDDRDVQVYAKGDELRHKRGKRAFEALAKEHPEVHRVVRLEVTLRSSEIRALFGLPSGWLPTLQLINPEVAAYVLVTEIRKHFRLHRDLARATKEIDTIAGLAGLLRSAAKARGETLTFSTLAQLVFTNRLLAVHKSSKQVAALFDVTRGHINKLGRKSIDLGYPPHASAESYSHACIAEFRRMFLEQYPGRPRKPVLSHRQHHEMTVDAPWVDADDTSRELDGMSVVEFEPEPLPLDAPGIGFGVYRQVEAAS